MCAGLMSARWAGVGMVLAAQASAFAATPPAPARPAASGTFTLYRCGPDGRDLRNTPCPREMAASELVRFTPDDAEAARAAQERNRQEARLLERQHQEREARERHEQEVLRQAPQAGSLGPAPPPTPAQAQETAAPRRHGPHARAKAPKDPTARTARTSKPSRKPPSPAAPTSTAPPPAAP